MSKRDLWIIEARRYAGHIWCYEGLVDDFPESASEAFERGDDPYEYVLAFGERYDLDRADQNWGINSGVTFEKRWVRDKVAAS